MTKQLKREERMKIETDDRGHESIVFQKKRYVGEREINLFDSLKEIGFFRNGEGPEFTLDEMRELLPILQCAVDRNTFKIPPRYKVEPTGLLFHIRNLSANSVGLEVYKTKEAAQLVCDAMNEAARMEE